MNTENWRWFSPALKLRSGTDIIIGGDTAEVNPFGLVTRAVCNMLNLPAGGTRSLFDGGTASDGKVYARVPELLWPAIAPGLVQSELDTVVTTAPAGWAVSTISAIFQPNPRKFNIIQAGDSLTQGTGTSTVDTRSTAITFAINGIAGQTMIYPAPTYREGESRDFYVGNTGIGSSSWANTVPRPDASDADGAAKYPRRQDLSFEQRVSTLCLNSLGNKLLFIYWLGTNDLAYDVNLSPEDAWQRVVTRITAFRAKFPNVPLALTTLIKRGMLTPLNTRINTFNNLMRNGYQALGVNYLIDYEALVSEVNIVTGNTSNGVAYTGDEVHLNDNGQSLIAVPLRNTIKTHFNIAA